MHGRVSPCRRVTCMAGLCKGHVEVQMWRGSVRESSCCPKMRKQKQLKVAKSLCTLATF